MRESCLFLPYLIFWKKQTLSQIAGNDLLDHAI